MAAARYVELNPLRARLTESAGGYEWSSAKAHLSGKDDGLCKVAPLLQLMRDWQSFIACGKNEDEQKRIRRHEHTGRPLGDESFLQTLEIRLGRMLRRLKPGPKAATGAN